MRTGANRKENLKIPIDTLRQQAYFTVKFFSLPASEESKMSPRKRNLGILAIALLVILGAVRARVSNYTIVIPKVLTYPTTTLTFSSHAVLAGSRSVAPSGVAVKFDDPNWAAAVSEAHLVTTAGGTYFKLSCQASSAACLQATRGSGSYTYALVPSGLPAPSKKGSYALAWDVNPPGDVVLDNVVVPEPGSLLLLGTGLLALVGLMRKKVTI